MIDRRRKTCTRMRGWEQPYLAVLPGHTEKRECGHAATKHMSKADFMHGPSCYPADLRQGFLADS